MLVTFSCIIVAAGGQWSEGASDQVSSEMFLISHGGRSKLVPCVLKFRLRQ